MSEVIKQLLGGTVLPIYKPLDWTSFDVIRKLQYPLKKMGPKFKIGHAGTLDPKAEGLLIVCTQSKTKLVESIQAQPKTYIAKIYLGATRPSYDLETEIDQYFDTKHITEDLLEQTLSSFLGKQQQTPPIYSAVKKDGKPAYLSARAGIEIEIKSKEIEVFQFKLLSATLPIIEVEMTVSKGTYIRTFAYDLGRKLNSGAYLEHLIRTRVGDFHIDQAHRIESIQEAINLFKETK